ncbi:hypothetical protein CDAR_313131 [Caerostris darwini]|uniref:Uncharacterized protein n=1 Tax=Caerostris darwini TaxID=1538125 RepID=A0AAV4UKD4_9ARAC|nr:hypothetical protein CDAR_313131 [Caerostris darwini]
MDFARLAHVRPSGLDYLQENLSVTNCMDFWMDYVYKMAGFGLGAVRQLNLGYIKPHSCSFKPRMKPSREQWKRSRTESPHSIASRTLKRIFVS